MARTLQDAIMEQLNEQAHQNLHDAAERLNEIAEEQRAQEERKKNDD